ncbi:iron chelate uptake ABC transporter family permease subunit [Streptomyces sp. DSM 110735]|nr:iron chelate uptake ABC transporter family permease subunit [Streptomyces sp. DSM 110735]
MNVPSPCPPRTGRSCLLAGQGRITSAGGRAVVGKSPAAVAVTIGPADISTGGVRTTVEALLGFGENALAPQRDGIGWNLRVPRILLAAVRGAGLVVCGAVMQSLLRNLLANPFVFGVSSGLSMGAVAVVVLGMGGGVVSRPAGAFLGALLSFALVPLLSHTLGGSTDRVVLYGATAM